MTTILSRASAWIIGIFLCMQVVYLPSCKRSHGDSFKADPAFSQFITAFTSGVISSESAVRVRLAAPYHEPVELNKPLPKGIFSFSPAIKGTAFWIDNQTIEFRPQSKLSSNTGYTARFRLGELLEVDKKFSVFEFGFRTIRQALFVETNGFKPYNSQDYRFNQVSGKVYTADVMEGSEVQKALVVKQAGKSFPLKWQHEPGGKVHLYTADSLIRSSSESVVTIEWKGRKIGLEKESEGKEELVLPPLDEFRLLDARVIQSPEQYVLLRFSDLIEKKQDLQGLISLSSQNTLNFVVEDNLVKAFVPTRLTGSMNLTVSPGIKNTQGKKFEEKKTFSLEFEQVYPAVRIPGKGVIMPGTNGIVMPFEAVSLKAVDVRVVKIYENNILHFLQVNRLDGSSQLKRSGRLILKKTILLGQERPVDLSRWNTYSLDLAGLVNTEPGAIYRVEIGFRKEYSVYACPGQEPWEFSIEGIDSRDMEDLKNEMAFYDTPQEYYYDYYYEDYDYDYEYDWRDRDNPCSPAYYRSSRHAVRNILASDLGLVAKQGSDGRFHVAVSDLKDTKPLGGVDVEVYSYQNQVIATAKTSNDGLANISLDQKPFLLVAKSGTQRGYLRLDDGSSLSLSRFDVDGGVVQRGIKGFIYGERGVWRPGDTLFLSFMLEDKLKVLPTGHPVLFELYNPMGQVVKRMSSQSGLNGLYTFIAATSPDAPTGNWMANVKVGGTTFSKTLRIETVKPNRLKINFKMEGDRWRASAGSSAGSLSVTWLHGAVARGLRARVNLALNPVKTTFEGYKDFVFDDPARVFQTEELVAFDGALTQEGTARVSPSLDVRESAPGMLQASFTVRVFEEGGDFSIDRSSVLYSPFSSYLGIKTPKGDRIPDLLVTGKNHSIEFVSLNDEGKPVDRDNLLLEVYKLDWRWWWDASGENLANFISRSYAKKIISQRVSTRGGKGAFDLKIDDADWGRYLVRIQDPASRHATGKTLYLDWPGWAGRASRQDPSGASMLTFTADKEKYKVGEQAVINFPSMEGGRALVSIESGSSILQMEWVETKKDYTSYKMEVTNKMTPNVYVHVTLVQPHARAENDLPIRMYGVIPLFVEDPSTRVYPQLSMPDVLRPEEKFKVKVSEKNKKGMTYTLALVDEGLLDLTRFRTPDPWPVFYTREALGVKTWDLYDQVIGAYGGRIEQLFSIGGDEELGGDEANDRANRFRPVVKFLGPFELKAGRTNEHDITLPPYVGSVRVMLVAGQSGAYGNTEKAVPVRNPLMVLATLPRVLGPGETVKLPVNVFAMEDQVKNVTVSVEVSAPLSITGSGSRQAKFESPGDQIVPFELKVDQGLGIGKVWVTAVSGNHRSTQEIEIEVRNPNPRVVSVIEKVLEKGESWETSFALVGLKGSNKSVLEISSLPPIDLENRLRYLVTYPHGCIEQTVSSVFPQLYLGDLVDLSPDFKKHVEENVKAGITRIAKFMLSDGGLSYWPGQTQANEWGTSYAGHFMIEAEARGYNLPQGFRGNWTRFQKKAARDWSPAKGESEFDRYQQTDLEQAYRLYTLALAGETETGAMNRLREAKNMSAPAAWRLAAAYTLGGREEAAREILVNLPTTVDPYQGFSSSYGSAERDQAMILETLVLLKDKQKAIQVARELSKSLSSNQWMSTQTTAWCLLSMSKFAKGAEKPSDIKYSFQLNQDKLVQAQTKLSLAQTNLNLKESGEQESIKVNNLSTGTLFVRLVLEGVPLVDPSGRDENNLRMTIRYRDTRGNPLDISALSQGTDFVAEVTVTHASGLGFYKDMALNQVFPSGWEIHNTRLDDHPGTSVQSFNYQDIRDDRVYTYFDLARGARHTFTVKLTAAYEGRFYLPAVSCEAMYDHTIFAREPGQWVEVLPAR